MIIQTCNSAGTPKACPNSAQRYLLALVPVMPELALLIVIEVALWIA
jgi:hypothetical protein